MEDYKPGFYTKAGLAIVAVTVIPGIIPAITIYYSAKIFLKAKDSLKRNPNRKTIEKDLLE